MLCEREVMDMKKAAFMIPHVGEIFEGVVSTLTRFGMFIELPNTVEGLMHISSFKEAMEFIEEKHDISWHILAEGVYYRHGREGETPRGPIP
ncbi:MAG: S1 RNA-binding domain-containing protein [Bacillus subtilis]|nr:S1 RNA-binding domain-containing protein [Bacillus subtilis]